MANNFVKFYRLDNAAYKAQTSKDANGIYFITDTQELIVNGVNYGMSKTLKDALNGAIDTVTWTSPNSIVFTTVGGTTETTVTIPNATTSAAGLMSADDKVILNTLSGPVDTEGSIKKQVADALTSAKGYTDTEIGKLNVTDTAVTGKYVSAVSETNGKISVTREFLPSVSEIKSDGKAIIAVSQSNGQISATAGAINAANVNVADASNHFTATTVEGVLDELYTKSGEGAAVTVEEAVGTEAGVSKVYTIKQGGKNVGKINIPKDLVVSSGSVVKGTWTGDAFIESASGKGTALKLVIANQEDPIYINTLDLVKDHTAGNGINISDTNVVSVVIDPTSESGLTLSDKGIKLTGIKAATTEVNVKTDGHVKVAKAIGENGQAVYTVSEDDIASADLLGTASDTKDKNTAFGKIAAEVANREAAINNLNANVNSTGGSHVKVNVVESAGKVTTVTVTETNIASAELLGKKEDASTVDTAFGRIAKEVADREAQDNKIEASVGLATDGSHVKTSGNYTKNATTIAGEIAALDTQVKNNADAIVTVKSYTVNGYTIDTNPRLNGGDIALTGYSAVTGGAIAGTNTVNQAINILENQLIWHEA